MTFATLEISGPVGIVRLCRAERLNAISLTLIDDLLGVLKTATSDPALAVLVLCGEGKAFCAGNDLKELDDLASDSAVATRFVTAIQNVSRLLMLSDKIIVGAVQGYAVGGGFEWLINCDLVVASDDLVAFFPEMALGQFVTGGVTWLLPRSLGYPRAVELLVLGERQLAQDLLRLGLINRVVSREELMPCALEMAMTISAKSRQSVAQLKRVMIDLDAAAFERALCAERDATIAALARDDAKNRVLEKFKNHH